jgi:hypothetical protein
MLACCLASTKLSGTHRYVLTDKGSTTITAVPRYFTIRLIFLRSRVVPSARRNSA